MLGTRKILFAAVATGALACLPIRPAAAAGPLLIAPWALAHIVLPLIVASVAAFQPPAPYGPSRAYAEASGLYAPPSYYARPPAYYGPSPGYYPPAYYRPALSYGPAMPAYAPPRGYYPSRPSYYGPYGGRGYSRAGGYSYRRR